MDRLQAPVQKAVSTRHLRIKPRQKWGNYVRKLEMCLIGNSKVDL